VPLIRTSRTRRRGRCTRCRISGASKSDQGGALLDDLLLLLSPCFRVSTHPSHSFNTLSIMLNTAASLVLALLAVSSSSAITIPLTKRDLGIKNADGSANIEGLQTEATRLLKCVLIPLPCFPTFADLPTLNEGNMNECVSVEALPHLQTTAKTLLSLQTRKNWRYHAFGEDPTVRSVKKKRGTMNLQTQSTAGPSSAFPLL
jgi:hypothetical protein